MVVFSRILFGSGAHGQAANDRREHSPDIAAWSHRADEAGSVSGGGPVPTPPDIGDDTCQNDTQDFLIPCATDDYCVFPAVCGNKSRYITIKPGSIPGDVPTSIRIEIVSLGPPFPAGHRVGEVWYAAAEQNVPNPPHPMMRGARAACTATPHAQVWTTGDLHLFGSFIVPGSTYDVRMCDAAGANCSSPLLVATCKYGDVIRPFGGSSQPSFSDVSATVAKFANRAAAPSTPRTDKRGPGSPGQPDTPNQTTSFVDIDTSMTGFLVISILTRSRCVHRRLMLVVHGAGSRGTTGHRVFYNPRCDEFKPSQRLRPRMMGRDEALGIFSDALPFKRITQEANRLIYELSAGPGHEIVLPVDSRDAFSGFLADDHRQAGGHGFEDLVLQASRDAQGGDADVEMSQFDGDVGYLADDLHAGSSGKAPYFSSGVPAGNPKNGTRISITDSAPAFRDKPANAVHVRSVIHYPDKSDGGDFPESCAGDKPRRYGFATFQSISRGTRDVHPVRHDTNPSRRDVLGKLFDLRGGDHGDRLKRIHTFALKPGQSPSLDVIQQAQRRSAQARILAPFTTIQVA